jgi:hypothetical protein
LDLNGGFKIRSFASQDIVPVYKHKGTVYNAYVMGVSITYLRAKVLLQGSQVGCVGILTCS